MRVAVWHNLPSGGGQRALYDQVQGLTARGHEVEIWSPPTADCSLLDYSKLVPYHLVPLARPSPATMYPIPHLHPDFTLGFRIRAMDKHCREAAAQIERGKFDILLSGACMEFGSPRIGRFVAIPSVLYLGEPHRRLYESPNVWALRHRAASLGDVLRSGKNLIRVQQLRRQVRDEIDNAATFDCLLVNSRFSAESVVRAYGLTSRVCYLGVRPELWKLDSFIPNRTVVGIGSISPHKRVHFVLAALARTAVPHPSLQWIGNSVSEQYLRDMSKMAESEGVEFTAHISTPHENMLNILRGASLLAYAPRLEPFGYAPLECAAAGLPTIAVAEGGVRETVVPGVTGLLVQDDVHEMADGIDALINDSVRLRELGNSAQEDVLQRWTLERAIDRLERELERLKRSR